MPFVTNVSIADVVKGRFPLWCDSNTILIQIQDVDNSPTAKFVNVKKRSRFIKVYQFRFDDVESNSSANQCTDIQAKQLANIIKSAKENGHNIVVHCHAGLCRSGAITECAVQYGFSDVNNNQRIPNLLVKKKVLTELGLGKSKDYYEGIWG